MTAQEVLKMALDCGVMIKVQGDNLRLDAKQAPPNRLLAEIKQHKSELLTLLAANDHDSNRYAHLTTCQQCEHLTSTGYCRVKPQYKPHPEAMRDCVNFERVSGERAPIENAPYSASELNDLLSRYEKTLFSHLLECKQCDFEAARYCPEVFTTGHSYDALLLAFNDAASKREALLNAVIRARISGRSVFVGLDYDNVPRSQQKPVKPITYGIGKQAERVKCSNCMYYAWDCAKGITVIDEDALHDCALFVESDF